MTTLATTQKLGQERQVGKWTIGIIRHDWLVFNPNWEVTTRDGQYFLWDKPDSEFLMLWIDTMRNDGSIFSNCCIPAHVSIHAADHRISIGIFKPEKVCRPDKIDPFTRQLLEKAHKESLHP